MTETENWRVRLPAAVVVEIDDEIERFRRAKAYEESAPRARETVERLCEISILAAELRSELDWLNERTPIGMAAIHDAAAAERVVFGRYEIMPARPVLEYLEKYARAAADQLRDRLSPIPGEGQGAGSSAGRLSDFRFVRYERGDRYHLSHFAGPKDQLGIGVLVAIYSDDAAKQLYEGATQRDHLALLAEIWADADGSDQANWMRVMQQLTNIKNLATEARQAKDVWGSVARLPENGEDAFSG